MNATLSDIPIWLVVTGAGVGAVAGIGMGQATTGLWPVTAGLGMLVGHFGTLWMLAGKVDRPEKVRRYNSETLRVAVVQPDGKAGQFAEFPVSRNQLVTLAAGLLDGQPFTEACWSGPRRPFTAREFSQVRAELIARRWAAWKSPGTPQRGAVVTAAGWAVMRYLAAPLPRGAAPRLELAT